MRRKRKLVRTAPGHAGVTGVPTFSFTGQKSVLVLRNTYTITISGWPHITSALGTEPKMATFSLTELWFDIIMQVFWKWQLT